MHKFAISAGEDLLNHSPTLLYPNLQKRSWSWVMRPRSPHSSILPDMVHDLHIQVVQHVDVGPAVSPVMFLLSVRKCVCAGVRACVCVRVRVHAIKAPAARRSDVLGAVMACWMVLFLGVCNLYMSYSNLSFYKSWLQINNPQMISWIGYLVSQYTHALTDCNIYTVTIIVCMCVCSCRRRMDWQLLSGGLL